MPEVITSTELRLEYTPEELRILAEDGQLNPEELTDWEIEQCLMMGLLQWTRENANRLLR